MNNILTFNVLNIIYLIASLFFVTRPVLMVVFVLLEIEEFFMIACCISISLAIKEKINEIEAQQQEMDINV